MIRLQYSRVTVLFTIELPYTYLVQIVAGLEDYWWQEDKEEHGRWEMLLGLYGMGWCQGVVPRCGDKV